jgi:leader peptidase (prepilin peptidase)/N-methyltransferase
VVQLNKAGLCESFADCEGVSLENLLYLATASVVGAGIGITIPPIVKKAVAFKCKKDGKPVPKNKRSLKNRILIVLLTMMIAILSIRFVPLGQVGFYIVFGVIAIIGTLIDNQIRIIPNELVLMLFIIGLVYRLLVTGFGGLLNSLLAFLFVVVIFSLAAGATFFLKKSIGVGAGDLKLAATIAFIVGLSGVCFFLFGMVAAILIYCLAGLFLRKLTIGSAFPMCGQIMVGFVIALFVPYVIPALPDYLLLAF